MKVISFNRKIKFYQSIKKQLEVVHIYNGILLSHKRNEIVSFVEMRMDLETVIQSEVSQRKTNIMFMHICRI